MAQQAVDLPRRRRTGHTKADLWEAPHLHDISNDTDVATSSTPKKYSRRLSLEDELPATLPLLYDGVKSFEFKHHETSTIRVFDDAETLTVPVDGIKPCLTKQQCSFLESTYQKDRKPGTRFKREISEKLGVPVDKVNNWFQNRRAKAKFDLRKQTNQSIDRLNKTISRLAPHVHSIEGPKIEFPSTPGWRFVERELVPRSSNASPTHCPSLSSGSTVASGNSSTGSVGSLQFPDHDQIYVRKQVEVALLLRPEPLLDHKENCDEPTKGETSIAFSKPPGTISPPVTTVVQDTSSKGNAERSNLPQVDSMEIAEITTSSRCLSLTSSNNVKSSDEETDWTEEARSPESQPDAPTALSPLKRQVVDQVMEYFHFLFDHIHGHTDERSPGFRTCNGETYGSGSSNDYSISVSGSSSAGSPYVSRKRSLSGEGSSPPDEGENNGDDPNKRQRPDSTDRRSFLPERRFACPYYKRNPGRHQTFTSCRDPGFIAVARLKEHLYRRHLLRPQCHRCCRTFANEPLLREHQRDLQGCEVQEQLPLEGFSKDQERKLRSKKRSQVSQSEEDKWKGVYHVLFPEDSKDEMPSPYIEYQHPGNSANEHSSNVARFQEFSRLELPRLVRRTLEVVVEEEAQPLEEKLKERLVGIVKECQTQLFSMFHDTEGMVGANETASQPLSAVDQAATDSFDSVFRGFESFGGDITLHAPADLPQTPTHSCVAADTGKHDTSPRTGSSGSPDSGYDSMATTVGDNHPEMAFYEHPEFFDLGSHYGSTGYTELNTGFDPSIWTFVDPVEFGPPLGETHGLQ